jgi:hypothetical protein
MINPFHSQIHRTDLAGKVRKTRVLPNVRRIGERCDEERVPRGARGSSNNTSIPPPWELGSSVVF